ncbi:beta-galactosidase [bacterium]|nr:beta-galactosidase [bacterium]
MIKIKSEVRVRKGAPRLFVNGKQITPAMYFLQAPHLPVQQEMIKQLAAQGIHLFTIPIDVGWHQPGIEKEVRFKNVDEETIALIKADKAALLLPRLSLNAPNWWCEEHPDELELFSDGNKDVWASWASKLWLQEACQTLAEFIEHCRQADYADHILGYHVNVGSSGEWCYMGSMRDDILDYSPPMQARFKEWLRDKYGTEDALRKAWKGVSPSPVLSLQGRGDDGENVTFDTACVPSKDEQLATDWFQFRDVRFAHQRLRPMVSKGTKVVDFFACLNETAASSAPVLCRTAKEACNGEQIVGVFYGYLATMSWNVGLFDPKGFANHELSAYQRSGHLALSKVLKSPDIDFIASPYDYLFRNIGGVGDFMSATESITQSGKLYWFEDDTRTHTVPGSNYGEAFSLDESISILRRNFGHMLTEDAALWWMEQGMGERSWFGSPEIQAELGRLVHIWEKTLSLERKTPTAEIAVIFDEKGPMYESLSNTLSWPLIYKQRVYGLSRMGAPYRFHLLNDLVEGKMPDYKLYIFLNCFYLNAAERKALDKKVKRDGNVALWLFGAGIGNERGLSLENMAELTGFQFASLDSIWELTCSIRNYQHPITQGLRSDTVFGTDLRIGPIITVSDPEATILGLLIFNQGRNEPGFAVKDFGKSARLLRPDEDGTRNDIALEDSKSSVLGVGDWSSVYSTAPNLPADLLRNIARYAGCHIYNEANDVIYASRYFICLHSAQGGSRTINLPKRTNVWDVFVEKQIASSVASFQADIPPGSTVLYYLGEDWLN